MAQEEVDEVVNSALDCGINFFDCAEAYGKDNCAEKALGLALKKNGRRKEAVIASKFGKHLPHWESEGLSEEKMYGCYTKKEINDALDKSLNALQIECIDLYQVHWPVNVGLLNGSKKTQEEVVETLKEAQKAGKIKFYGVCNFGTEDLDYFTKAGGVPCTNQICYNLLWRSIEYFVYFVFTCYFYT